MNIDETFPRESGWINHADLQGRAVKVTITAVGVHEFEDGKRQPAVSFMGTDKKLGLNVINRETIKSSYGPETDNWVGKDIILFKSTTPFGNKIVDCVRLRCPAQQATGLPGALGAAAFPLPASTARSVFDTPSGATAVGGTGSGSATDGGHTPAVTPPFEPPKEQTAAEELDDSIPF